MKKQLKKILNTYQFIGILPKIVIYYQILNEFFYNRIIKEIYDFQESLYNVNVPREYQSIIKNYEYVNLLLDGIQDNYIITTPLVENIKIYNYLDNRQYNNF